MNLKELVNDKIYNAPLSKINTEGKCIINTINPHSYCLAKKDSIFEKALLDSDVLLPDGTGIVLAVCTIPVSLGQLVVGPCTPLPRITRNSCVTSEFGHCALVSRACRVRQRVNRMSDRYSQKNSKEGSAGKADKCS